MKRHTVFAKRILQAVITVFGVITITFGLIRLMPGGPMDFLMAHLSQTQSDMTQEEIAALAEAYLSVNPEEPIHIAYLNYMASVLQGDLGHSIWNNRPVIDILAEALPWTILYSSLALFLSFFIGVTVGALMAYHESSKFDYGSTVLSVVTNSIPFYVFGIALLALFGYYLGWFPTGGRMYRGTEPGFNLEFWQGVAHHVTLPVLSAVLTAWGGTAIAMRGNAISVLGKDYIRVAQLRGLADRRIAIRYVGRNAILPLYTGLMISIGTIIGGSVVLEEVFRYNGIGYYLFQGVSRRDTPLMMGGFLLITIAVVIGILVADLTYHYIDPRAQSETKEAYGSSPLKKLRIKLRKLRKRDDEDGERRLMTDGSTGTPEFPFAYPVEEIESHERGRWQQRFQESVLVPLKIAFTDWRTSVGLLIIAGFVLMGTVGVWLVEPTSMYDGEQYIRPFQTMEHPLGTDSNGQDLLALTIHSTPTMFKMIFAGAIFTTVIATIVGTFTGYVGGSVDRVLMTITDIAMTIPGLPLVMVLAVTIEPTNPYLVGILLTINAWAGLARTIRSEVLSLREESYVEASRIMGASTPNIINKDIVPNLMPYILINFVGAGRGVIFGSVALYFLGILPFSNQNWGIMLNQAYEGGALVSISLFYWLLIPMVVISLLSIGLILAAQGLDRVFNVRIRTRHTAGSDGESEEDTASVQPQSNL
ncbi:ABC transporter permease subunit [Halomontanus rarus]|uniref:ABC transporter permease subunit n=1 Tax=Halomontanus rarus TaxID=3034020 RepID=UPI0023E82B89|nr:ABC transporter permease subunit [Halovivax sp. TS33]